MIPHFELVQLDTISGNTLSPFSCGPVRLLGMGDDGKTVFFGNECIETYDVISRNRTPTNVKVAYTMSVAVFGDIVTVFQVSSRDINAIDLATGENLYKIRLPEELLNRQEDLDWYFGGALSKNRGVILLVHGIRIAVDTWTVLRTMNLFERSCTCNPFIVDY
jgi:hypothetical protein